MLQLTSTRPRQQCGEEYHNLPRLAIQNLGAVGRWQCFHLAKRRLRHSEDPEAHNPTFTLGNATMAIHREDDVPVAHLEVLNLDLLLLRDPAEQQRLRRVCASTGFFYLDLREHGAFESDWWELLEFGREYFALPDNEKLADARGSDVYG